MWWLTIAQSRSRCADCKQFSRPGAAIFYNPGDRQALCQWCGNSRGLDAMPSKSLLAARREAVR